MEIGTLDLFGVLLAIGLGYLLTYFGGFECLALMLTFLFVSTVVTYFGEEEKRQMGVFEEKRSAGNVFWNGLAPLLFVLLGWKKAFVGSVAALLADKVASELGVLEGEALELFTWKRVKAGRSGAVSVTGLLASYLGAGAVVIVAVGLFSLTWSQALLLSVMGFLGSLLDSLLGFFEERGIGTKGTTNFMASFFAGLLSKFLIG